MIFALLFTALTASAAPTKRQTIGTQPGYQIEFPIPQQFTNPTLGSDLCLATNPDGGSGVGDGTPVGFVNCRWTQTVSPDQPFYSLWQIQPGNQLSVQLVGTNYCLDAGSNPGSSPSAPAKVWQCYPGLEQQQFYYTNTDHIAVTGSTPCLDYSFTEGTNFVGCGSNYDNNDIQAFNLVPINQDTSPTATTSMAPSSTASAAPTEKGYVINWLNGNDLSQCLTVTNGQYYNGSPVGLAPCGSVNEGQRWVYHPSGVTSVRAAGQNYCLDFGDGGGYDGVPMKLWQCYPGLFQQTLYYTGTNHIAVYNGNQCLDVEAGTSNVQGWQCSGDDVHQLWQNGFPA